MRVAIRSLLIWLYVGASVLVFLPGTTLLFLLSVIDRDRWLSLHWTALFSRLNFRINPMWRLEVRGKERLGDKSKRKGPYVIVSNHQSLGDILVVSFLPLRYRYVAKQELFSVPGFGWQLWMAGHLGVRRGDKESAARLFARSKRVLSRGVSILYFAEGTRSTTLEVGPFKSGAFQLAVASGVAVLPVVVAGTSTALPKHSWRFTERSFCFLELLDPVDPAGHTVESLRDTVRAAIAERKTALEIESRERVERWK